MVSAASSKGRLGWGVTMAAAVFAAGCAAPLRPVSTPPTPSLQLRSTGALALPQDCQPARGAVYRTSFTVQPGGQVAQVASESGQGCVQDALREWVATFEYHPIGAPTPTVVDWMGVSASRGG